MDRTHAVSFSNEFPELGLVLIRAIRVIRCQVIFLLHFLTVDTEQQVRQNITQWAEQIHHAPGLTSNEEQRLLMVMTQLIEEKFKTLTYKELSNMLKLTPLKETVSGQELLQEGFAEILIKLVKRKFKAAESTFTRVEARINQLTLRDLKDLFDEILDMTSIRELNAWMNARISLRQNPDPVEDKPLSKSFADSF